ncbi:ABC transporter, ATP-binding protein [Paenibacillus pasadenensis]|uniref:ABC transporter, ATP-binding protein n=1 Tax=Paenibacillus pasadenensis TaxID=217090 RepID=A0A2N5N9F3_9BACL|nr:MULTISPECIES: AAA family ATPase [Paenibacillus]PLT46987.1 ABC transporter, ATP-binding protein [Paenibacillus pasadenensis]QGG57326.1 AAA family ATPase [Paenibacillus sp. B01]
MSRGPGYLKSIELLRSGIANPREYPFSLPAVRTLERLPLHPKVTYLIGENGTGKSTLLEAIAVAWGFNPEGGTINFSFSTAETHSELHRHLRLARGVHKPRDGFFFRAESYYNLASEIERLDRPDGARASGPPIIDSYGGKPLHEQSHGESFFAAFLHRFGGRGLYILDEPEAALSPQRQLSMLSRIHQLVQKHSQFIIATHSPILMAYPDADIYLLGPDGAERVELEQTPHWSVMKQFVNRKQAMLDELLADD